MMTTETYKRLRRPAVRRKVVDNYGVVYWVRNQIGTTVYTEEVATGRYGWLHETKCHALNRRGEVE